MNFFNASEAGSSGTPKSLFSLLCSESLAPNKVEGMPASLRTASSRWACAGIRMAGNVEDQEGWDSLVLCDVGDGGEVDMFGRIVSKLLAMTVFGLRLLMDASARFGGFDNGGNVVCITIDWNASF